MHTVMNQNTTLIRKQNRDEIALQKYTMILPLLDETMDPAALRELREKLAEQNGLSERTLRRYVNAYQKNGFEGLKPAERVRYKKEMMPDNYEEILQEAIQLRREVPRRSVEQIIFILESEGKVAPGLLKRPTLQRHLYQVGICSYGHLSRCKEKLIETLLQATSNDVSPGRYQVWPETSHW